MWRGPLAGDGAPLALFGLASLLPAFSLQPSLLSSTNIHKAAKAMPIAPITGKLRKRLWLDLSTSLGLGTACAYFFWSVFYSSFRETLYSSAHTGTTSISSVVSSWSKTAGCNSTASLHLSDHLHAFHSPAPGGVLPRPRAQESPCIDMQES